jgi:hypothetical protein
MPSKSEKQRRFLFANKGKKWVKKHHFDKLRRGKKKKG